MGEIDQGKPGSGKNARTVLQSVTVYAPEALRGDLPKLREWFHRVGELAEQQFRPENVIDMAVDVDEVHSYLDEQEKVWKLAAEHGHLWLVPEVDGKLNGKQFSRRAAIVKFNDAIQYMTEREFGCAFNDGTKKKRRGTVEQLKANSLRAEVEQLEAQAATIIQDALDAATDTRAEARRDARATRREADNYAYRTRRKANRDAVDTTAQADQDAEATREAARREAQEIRAQAERDAQALREQVAAMRRERDAAKADRDEARKDERQARQDAQGWAVKAHKLKQAHDGLQTALVGDVRAVEAQEAKRGATALLAALGASVRPMVMPTKDTPQAVRDGLAAVKPSGARPGAVWAELQRRYLGDSQGPTAPGTDGPTLG